MTKRIAILGLDTFAEKNVSQLIYLNRYNYFYDVFTIDNRNNSLKNIQKTDPKNNLILIKRGVPGIYDRLIKLVKYIRKYKTSIHHFELYPNAPYSFVFILLAKLFKIKTIVVERGDIGEFKFQSLFSQVSMSTCYKLGDVVWYKEPYMKPLLMEKGAKNLVFIHNAAESNPSRKKENFSIDFLWVNRFEPMRKADWVIEAMKKPELQNNKCVMIGYQDLTSMDQRYLNPKLVALQNLAKSTKGENTEIIGFTDPTPFYQKAKFFVLPAERVFGNNSLLEAMSFGLVPIVTNKNNTDLLVTDNFNGIICNYDYESFSKALQGAANLSIDEYERLSNNARKTIEGDFSNQKWTEKMIKTYNSLD